MAFYICSLWSLFTGIFGSLLVYTVFYAELPQAPVCAELSVYNVCSIITVS